MWEDNYFFEIDEKIESEKVFVLIIYDIVDNKKRLRLSKPSCPTFGTTINETVQAIGY